MLVSPETVTGALTSMNAFQKAPTSVMQMQYALTKYPDSVARATMATLVTVLIVLMWTSASNLLTTAVRIPCAQTQTEASRAVAILDTLEMVSRVMTSMSAKWTRMTAVHLGCARIPKRLLRVLARRGSLAMVFSVPHVQRHQQTAFAILGILELGKRLATILTSAAPEATIAMTMHYALIRMGHSRAGAMLDTPVMACNVQVSQSASRAMTTVMLMPNAPKL
mmetsp:Transcript_14054/g.36229  ORF Transcript_14054/g.36229 Transcript_14054/m.36229 type:complete len:223 (+) Transcript_14054:889-1557(+)